MGAHLARLAKAGFDASHWWAWAKHLPARDHHTPLRFWQYCKQMYASATCSLPALYLGCAALLYKAYGSPCSEPHCCALQIRQMYASVTGSLPAIYLGPATAPAGLPSPAGLPIGQASGTLVPPADALLPDDVGDSDYNPLAPGAGRGASVSGMPGASAPVPNPSVPLPAPAAGAALQPVWGFGCASEDIGSVSALIGILETNRALLRPCVNP